MQLPIPTRAKNTSVMPNVVAFDSRTWSFWRCVLFRLVATCRAARARGRALSIRIGISRSDCSSSGRRRVSAPELPGCSSDSLIRPLGRGRFAEITAVRAKGTPFVFPPESRAERKGSRSPRARSMQRRATCDRGDPRCLRSLSATTGYHLPQPATDRRPYPTDPSINHRPHPLNPSPPPLLRPLSSSYPLHRRPSPILRFPSLYTSSRPFAKDQLVTTASRILQSECKQTPKLRDIYVYIHFFFFFICLLTLSLSLSLLLLSLLLLLLFLLLLL